MSTAANARYSGIDGRRSTRVDHPVTLIILGKNGLGQPFQEKTASVSVNLHGCRYPSRHEYPVGSWVGLQVVQADGQPRSPLMRAQVRSIHGAPREQFEVGVELETPANVWGVTTPPADWVRLTNGEHSTTHLASGGNLPREPQNQQSHGAQNGEVDSSKQSSTPKTERFVITSDQLILSVRPKLTQAAEQAIQSAIADKLDSAVRDALSKIDDVHRAGAREVADHSVQRFETLLRTSEEAILTHLEMRLSEMRSQWEEQQNAQKSHMQGISDQLDKIVAATRQVMGPDQQTSGKSAQSMMEPALLDGRIQARMDEYVNRATREFEASAARVSDRHLVRLMEDKQMVSREASAQIEARASEARASLHSAASEVVEEFRRQLETQVSTTIAEASQRASSALSSLDAESRSAIETRRRSLETDVTKAAEQSAEQFRTGIKAFLYSCLVAAVSAVDEHSQSTLEGLVKDAPKEGKENGHNGKLSHQFAITDDSSNKDREN